MDKPYKFHKDGWEHRHGLKNLQARAAEILPMRPVERKWKPPRHARKLARAIRRHLGQVRLGAEVGVCRGETSLCLLENFSGLTLIMVDPWREIDDKDPLLGDQMSGQDQAGHDESRREALERTELFRDRRIVIEKPSVEAAELFRDNLDFVFIDAIHTYEAVADDIRAWWPCIRHGGLLMGHDYAHPRYRGVQRAVDDFAPEVRQPVMEHGATVWSVWKLSV